MARAESPSIENSLNLLSLQHSFASPDSLVAHGHSFMVHLWASAHASPPSDAEAFGA